MKREQLIVSALDHGTVIDHIPCERLFQVINLLHLDQMTSKITIGYNLKSQKMGTKSIIKIADKFFTDEELNQLIPVLAGNTAVMYSESPNAPAKLIKKLQKDLAGKPELKGAYVQECAFVGADKLDELCAIKSKEELIGDIISLLQSPMRNVISALQNGGGQTIAGLVKTLSEKEEK
jgi:ribosomal protein L10